MFSKVSASHAGKTKVTKHASHSLLHHVDPSHQFASSELPGLAMSTEQQSQSGDDCERDSSLDDDC